MPLVTVHASGLTAADDGYYYSYMIRSFPLMFPLKPDKVCPLQNLWSFYLSFLPLAKHLRRRQELIATISPRLAAPSVAAFSCPSTIILANI